MLSIPPQVEVNFNPCFNFSALPIQPAVLDCSGMDKPLFAHRILARLRAIGKTQSWLAEEMGVSNETVSKWIRVGSASMDKLPGIARLLNCSFGYLLGDEDDDTAAEVAESVRRMSPSQKEQMRIISQALLDADKQSGEDIYKPRMGVGRGRDTGKSAKGQTQKVGRK